MIPIGNKNVGNGHPCFLTAEAGTTCNGDYSSAVELIDTAAKSGFDAIKFQMIWPDQISDKTTVYRYRTASGWAEENMHEMFKSLAFTSEQWHDLAAYARKIGIIFFSTVDYHADVDILERCKVPVYKIGAWDITYDPLLRKVAQTGKPVMLDLGPAFLSDVLHVVELFRESCNNQIILLHDFHTNIPGEMNMRTIPYLKNIFKFPIGFSAPGIDNDLDVIATALGADVLEKRITLSRRSRGHHHIHSLEPNELKPWVDRIRFVESSLGKEGLSPSEEDSNEAKKYYRSICTTRHVHEGECFSLKNIDGKRPGSGIPTRFMDIFINRKAKRELPVDTLLTWDDL